MHLVYDASVYDAYVNDASVFDASVSNDGGVTGNLRGSHGLSIRRPQRTKSALDFYVTYITCI